MPTPSPTLRPLTLADYAAVLDLWQKTEGLHIGESDTPEAIAAFLQRNPGLSQVATLATGKIVGAVLCGHDGRRGYLHHLAVTPAQRQQGIGRALVDRCLALLRAQGITRCNILLITSNTLGQAFWQREGWKLREDVRLVQKILVAGIDD